MDRIPKRTRAEQETLFRFDEDEHVLCASTTTPRVVTRWQRAGYPVRVLGRSRDMMTTSMMLEVVNGWPANATASALLAHAVHHPAVLGPGVLPDPEQ
jgi:hypothetical protein